MIGINVNSEDKFSLIKDKLSSAAVVRLEVLITVESKIFDVTDSTFGKIILAEDGRYRAELGNDIYLNDGKINWEYSKENNQATKRKLKKGEIIDNRLAFFKDIDSFYKSVIIKQDLIYKLIKLDKIDEALPDSMTITLEKDSDQISKIEYFDLNDDRNTVYISKEYYEDKIDEHLFDLDLPDSTEIISLP